MVRPCRLRGRRQGLAKGTVPFLFLPQEPREPQPHVEQEEKAGEESVSFGFGQPGQAAPCSLLPYYRGDAAPLGSPQSPPAPAPLVLAKALLECAPISFSFEFPALPPHSAGDLEVGGGHRDVCLLRRREPRVGRHDGVIGLLLSARDARPSPGQRRRRGRRPCSLVSDPPLAS